MSVLISGKYLGAKKVELCHVESGMKITTAAPKDNNGDGSSFRRLICLQHLLRMHDQRNRHRCGTRGC